MATSTEWATSGVELLVEVRGGNATVLSAARVPNVPRLDLMAPLMTEENLPRLRSDDRELVLTIIGPTGRNPTSFGFPVVARQYFDFRDAATGLTRGGPRPIRPDEPDLRAIRLPWSADCTAILLHTTAVGADYSTSHERRLVVSGVTLYQADTQRAVAGPMPPGIPVERPLDLPWLPEWAPDTVRPVPYGPADAWTADGRFVGWDSPVLVGDPARCFDIMITGDGFTDAEMPQFDEWAVKLREGLQKVEPFQSLARYINWHVARVASTDSGIDQCPDPRDPSHKRTFFGVEGGWNNSDCPGYMGLHHVPRLMWVAEQGCGWEHLEVALVIANCSTWGGHSWPAAKTAIVPGLAPCRRVHLLRGRRAAPRRAQPRPTAGGQRQRQAAAGDRERAPPALGTGRHGLVETAGDEAGRSPQRRHLQMGARAGRSGPTGQVREAEHASGLSG
jgi:hypothetical protein